MPGTDDIFGKWIAASSLPTGQQLKAEGMDRAARHANPAWKQAAHEAVLVVARRQEFLTADDVMAAIGPGFHTHELRALGPVMLAAARCGWIEKAQLPPGNSNRAHCHRGLMTIWRSLIR